MILSLWFSQITRRDFWVLWMNFLSTDIFETEEMKVEDHLVCIKKEEKNSSSDNLNDKQDSFEIHDPEFNENESDCEEKLAKKSILNFCLETYRARFSKSRRLLPYFFEDDIVVTCL